MAPSMKNAAPQEARLPAEPDTGPSVGKAANVTVGTQTAPAVAASVSSLFGCIVTDFNVFWSATLKDYDGAPDATGPTSLIGHGRTELEAIANLLEQLKSQT
jgi:hypothetical protein